MKKIIILSLLIFTTSILLVGCNSPDSAIQTDGNSKITVDVDKAVDNVDGFFEGIVDKITNPSK